MRPEHAGEEQERERVNDRDSARPHRLLALPSYMMAGGRGTLGFPGNKPREGRALP